MLFYLSQYETANVAIQQALLWPLSVGSGTNLRGTSLEINLLTMCFWRGILWAHTSKFCGMWTDLLVFPVYRPSLWFGNPDFIRKWNFTKSIIFPRILLLIPTSAYNLGQKVLSSGLSMMDFVPVNLNSWDSMNCRKCLYLMRHSDQY